MAGARPWRFSDGAWKRWGTLMVRLDSFRNVNLGEAGHYFSRGKCELEEAEWRRNDPK